MFRSFINDFKYRKEIKKEAKRSKNNTPKLKYNVLENETVRQDQKLQNKIFSPKINRLNKNIFSLTPPGVVG